MLAYHLRAVNIRLYLQSSSHVAACELPIVRDPDAGAHFTYVERKDGSTSYCGSTSCWPDGHEREWLSHRADGMFQKEIGMSRMVNERNERPAMVEVYGLGSDLPLGI